jgi:acetyl esterase/lipase
MSDPADSMHLVDPELADLLEAMPTRDFDDALVAAMRAAAAQAPPPTVPETGTLRRVIAVPGPGDGPDVPLTLTMPEGTAVRGCILHMHGGGYVIGSAAAYEPVHRPMAAQRNCVIASVDYRHGPEDPFPAPLEDCYAALAWLYAHADDLGIDTARIGVMGESAGGGMAAALALLARDRGEYPLAFQHLVYPMIDDRTGSSATPNPYAGALIWTPHNNRYGWRAYLGREPGGADTPPYAAAARHTDLSGLPPCFLLTAALDLFIDENLDYAARLIRAGVPTELHVLPRAFHAFDGHPTAAVARRAWALRMEALGRALG